MTNAMSGTTRPDPVGSLNELLDSEELPALMTRAIGTPSGPSRSDVVGRATGLLLQYADLAPEWRDTSYFVPLSLITDASDDRITKHAIERLRASGVLEADPRSGGQGVDVAYRVNIAALGRYAENTTHNA